MTKNKQTPAKKVLPPLLILFVLSLSLFAVSTVNAQSAATQTETKLFSDDFESYITGTFPTDNWDLWYSGAGTSEQRISSIQYSSSQNSLRLLGGDIASIIGHQVTLYDTMGFKAKVWVDGNGGTGNTAATVCFGRRFVSGQSWGAIAGVDFTDKGKIEVLTASGDTEVSSYQTRSWYEIQVELDIQAGTYQLYVNGQLLSSNVHVWTNYGETPANTLDNFVLSSSGAKQIVYFDYVSIFTYTTNDFAATPTSTARSTLTTTPTPIIVTPAPTATANSTSSWLYIAIVAIAAIVVVTVISIHQHQKKLNNSPPPPPSPPVKSFNASVQKGQRICSKCGANLPSESKFCGKCGASL
jgi:hypothetical protein